jgi:signal transduction histidine kinase
VTFHKNSLKLAGLYLAIIMCISLFFSAVIYQLSTQELERGLRRPIVIQTQGDIPAPFISDQARDLLNQQARDRYEEARDHVVSRLIVTNLLILLVAGFVSYFLAVRTLRPIEEANESLERFTADASHELRTPLAAMRTEIEVALMDPKLKVSEARKLLESNLEELAKLTALSEGLLKLARRETDHLQDAVQLKSVIDEAVQRAEPMAARKNIKFDVQQKDAITVLGDQIGLTEAVHVLLDNAIKYSPEKTTVSVTTTSKQKQAIVQVTDHGVGIQSTDVPHIFERFYRADAARSKRQVEGYGIGLALAKHIVDMHGGTITVASKPDKGTTFTIHLPIT